jgi:hypothetical protein
MSMANTNALSHNIPIVAPGEIPTPATRPDINWARTAFQETIRTHLDESHRMQNRLKREQERHAKTYRKLKVAEEKLARVQQFFVLVESPAGPIFPTVVFHAAKDLKKDLEQWNQTLLP